MLPVWMAYSIVVGALVCAGALALEHVVGIWRLPRRGVWITAMLVAVVWPFVPSIRSPTRAQPDVFVSREAPSMATGGTVMSVAPRLLWRIRVYDWSLRVDRPTRLVWRAASTMVALVFAGAVLSMFRRQRSWREGVLHGHRVWFTDDIGPAVVGFVRPRIVIPEWALSLPARERRLMLEHEVEHVRANDPGLLALAGLVLMLFPWNAPLWFMARQLRLAIEIDCDARVIGVGEPAEEYGLFLVAVGERRVHGLFLAASLAERRSSLERRICAMTILRPRHPLLASIPFAALALGAAALAAQTPTPPESANPAHAMAHASMMPHVNQGIQLTADQIRSIVAAKYPGIANGTSEENVVTIVLASSGEVVRTGAVESKEASVADHAGAVHHAMAATHAVPAVSEEMRHSAAARAVHTEEARHDTLEGPLNWWIPAIGLIDRTRIKGVSAMRYAAGAVAPHAISVNIVTLTGNSTSR
jgi:hypothetical protein